MLFLVAIWAFAEAVLWFVVADVPIMAVGALYGRRKALLAAGIAAAMSALGGMAVMVWAGADPAGATAAMVALPGIDEALFAEVVETWRADGTWGMMLGSFTGVPYKLYALAASQDGTSMAAFFVLSVLARLPRFVMVALVSGTLAIRLRGRMGDRWFWALFVWTWLGFYVWYFETMGW